MSRQQDFMTQMYNMASRAGLPDHLARVAAAQAALETGYGRSVKGNNFFGIKAGRSWTGPVQNFNTWEEIGGKRQNITDAFRAYENPEESFRDWYSLMANRFPGVLTARTFEEAVDALNAGKRGGYATDSKYDDKLEAIDSRIQARGYTTPQIAPVPSERGVPVPMNMATGDFRAPPIQTAFALPETMQAPTSKPPAMAAPFGTVERAALPSIADIATAKAYSEYGASRRAAPAPPSPSRPDNFDYSGPKGNFNVLTPEQDYFGPAVSIPKGSPAVDPITVQANVTPAPVPPMAGGTISVPNTTPPMADNTPVAPGFPPAPGFPEAPRSPEAQRNRDMAIGGLGGLAKGGIPGAIIGAVAAPAVAQIRGNIRSNRVAPPGGRQNIFNGVRQVYNPMAAYGGPGMLGRLGGLLSTPDFTTPGYNTGSGYDAISGVFGAPAGAMAFSRSDPNVGWRSLGNGMAVRTNSKYGTSRYERAEDYGGRTTGRTGGGGLFGGFFSGLFGGGGKSESSAPSKSGGKK